MLRRLNGSTRHRLSFRQQLQHLSSTASATRDETQESNNVDDTNPPKQPFATFKLKGGEWDIDRKDPFHRPEPPQRSKLISAEDFANRPPVGFENEFSSYDDAMISLSWLDQTTCKQIFQTYIDLMMRAQKNSPGRTSHEYVCRVLAQQFQITPWRAAGVIQLQHNEEQMRQNHPELLCEEQAKHAENMIKRNIQDAYRSDRYSLNPNLSQPFVEDPVGIHGRGPPDEMSSSSVSADDIFDLEAKVKAADERDEKLARILLDEHVFKEDVDESTLEVRTDGSCKRLLKAHEQQRQRVATSPPKREIPYPATNAQGEKRPRWKYVAKVVNTRAMRDKGRRQTSYTNHNMENTLVEEDGNLRIATVEEAKQAAWKPSRTKGNQYIYEGVQRAWLEHSNLGKTGVWGMAPKRSAVAAVERGQDFEISKEVEIASSPNGSAAPTFKRGEGSDPLMEVETVGSPSGSAAPAVEQVEDIDLFKGMETNKPSAVVDESTDSEAPSVDDVVLPSTDLQVAPNQMSDASKDTDEGNNATNDNCGTDGLTEEAVVDENSVKEEEKK
jgi:hypothetical protein